MLLTDDQLQQIRQIVSDHHNAFIANTVSPDAIAPDILKSLKAKGLINVEVSSIQDSYTYGQILAAMDDPKTATMNLAQFRQYVQRNPVSLTGAERHAISLAQQQAANYVVGLGAKVSAQTGQMLIEADDSLRRQQRDAIQTKTAQNIDARQTVKQLKSDLGHATGDWTRDLERVANYEKQDAMQQGMADAIAKQDGSDAEVFKRFAASCCDDCRALYSDGSNPRVFTLAELEANGTNVGKKRSEWLPTLGPAHPFCTCQLARKPKGWSFNKRGELAPGAAEKSLRKSAEVHSRVRYQGLPVAIERPAGSIKVFRGPNGLRTKVMPHAYGYIEGSHGADGEEIDCYVGPNTSADNAYLVHQLRPGSDVYDEDKVMLGFDSIEEAEQEYRGMYDKPGFFGGISPMPMDAFRRYITAQADASPIATPSVVKSQLQTGPTLVISLDKATDGQRVSADVAAIGSETSRREIRTNAADGSNYLFNVPVRAGKNRRSSPDSATLSIRRFLKEATDDPALAPHMRAEDLDIVQATPVLTHTLHIIPQSPEDHEAQVKNAEVYKQALDDVYQTKTKKIPNRMPVDGRTPVLETQPEPEEGA